MTAVTTPSAVWSTTHQYQSCTQWDQHYYQHHPPSNPPSSSTDPMMPYHHTNDAGRGLSVSCPPAAPHSSYHNFGSGNNRSCTTPIRDDLGHTAGGASSALLLDAFSYPYAGAERASKKRSRSSKYVDEGVRQAAKLMQKARRREQNRNAQRRLRDRKEEHIFKVSHAARLQKPSRRREPCMLTQRDSVCLVVGGRGCFASATERTGSNRKARFGRDGSTIVGPAGRFAAQVGRAWGGKRKQRPRDGGVECWQQHSAKRSQRIFVWSRQKRRRHAEPRQRPRPCRR